MILVSDMRKLLDGMPDNMPLLIDCNTDPIPVKSVDEKIVNEKAVLLITLERQILWPTKKY